MYAGFITPKRVINKVGIHQRLDVAAYRLIAPYVAPGTFPAVKSILQFEGYNGPDGLNTKTGLKPKTKDDPRPSHLYDPINDCGEVPGHIQSHYRSLVRALKDNDDIRASFEAAWLAHYVCDGLTPAHHWPLEDKVAEAAERAAASFQSGDTTKFTATVKKHWTLWGAKGHMSTHFYFEMGIAFALLLFPIRPLFSEHELVEATQLGPVDYFKREARAVADFHLYERFYREGWTNDLAVTIKNRLAPRVARAIGVIWMLAYLEAGLVLATVASHETIAASHGTDPEPTRV